MDHFLALNSFLAEFHLRPSTMGGGFGHEASKGQGPILGRGALAKESSGKGSTTVFFLYLGI